MKLSDKLKKFKSEYQEAKSISENMLSVQEKLAFEVIEELEQLVEEQHKVIVEGLCAIGDYGMAKSFKEGKLGAKEIALVISRCFDNNTSIEKQLETAFYSFQKSATEKMNKMGEEIKSTSISDMIVYEPKKKGEV